MEQNCIKCIEQVKQYNKEHKLYGDNKTTTACISYENELYHHFRMVHECPLLQAQLNKIFDNVEVIKNILEGQQEG